MFVPNGLVQLTDNTFVVSALAEILSVKEVHSMKLYYVHYVDCEYNARMGIEMYILWKWKFSLC